MAAISCIAGSVLGWIVAAVAFLSGADASTAVLLFFLTSLTMTAARVFKAAMCVQGPR
jgi:hypothetical protein